MYREIEKSLRRNWEKAQGISKRKVQKVTPEKWQRPFHCQIFWEYLGSWVI